jgi:hypothetical protein
MNAQDPALVAKVTKQKSGASDRFQCFDIYELWDSGEITVDHCVEDEEWGGIEETQEVTDGTELPEGFFKAGVNRVMDHGRTVREEPL